MQALRRACTVVRHVCRSGCLAHEPSLHPSACRARLDQLSRVSANRTFPGFAWCNPGRILERRPRGSPDSEQRGAASNSGHLENHIAVSFSIVSSRSYFGSRARPCGRPTGTGRKVGQLRCSAIRHYLTQCECPVRALAALLSCRVKRKPAPSATVRQASPTHIPSHANPPTRASRAAPRRGWRDPREDRRADASPRRRAGQRASRARGMERRPGLRAPHRRRRALRAAAAQAKAAEGTEGVRSRTDAAKWRGRRIARSRDANARTGCCATTPHDSARRRQRTGRGR